MGKNKDEKKLSTKNTGRIAIIIIIIKGFWWSFFVSFSFFFFSALYTESVASPFEAVERGPRWRCCRIDLVPTFALRGRRGTVFAGARVMSTSS